MLFDLHVHTNKSPCSEITHKQLISTAIHRGLDGVCITDHDMLTVPPRSRHLQIFSGIEISSSEGHILAYGVNEHIPAMKTADETIDLIHDQGGVAIPAHPYRKNPLNYHFSDKTPWALGDRMLELSIDGIETLNGGCTKRENFTARKSAKLLDLPQIGGSDAHDKENIGNALTKVDNLYSIDKLINELKHKRTTPLLYQHKSIATRRELKPYINGITIILDLDNFNIISKKAGWNGYKPNRITGSMSKLVDDFAHRNHASIIYGLDWERGTEEAYLVLNNIELPTILNELEEIRQKIEEVGATHAATISIGLAIHKPLSRIHKIVNRRTLHKLPNVKQALFALKKSKKKGGNIITVV